MDIEIAGGEDDVFKVLVVEDERWEREGLICLIDWPTLGLEIIGSAVDGLDGYEKAMELKPDIMITDIRMPGMNGLEMSKRVREHLPHVRIVMLTGFSDFEYTREAILLQADDYILKPIEEEDMKQTMQQVAAACSLEREKRFAELGLFIDLTGIETIERAEQARRDFAEHAQSFLAEWQEYAKQLRLHILAMDEAKTRGQLDGMFAMIRRHPGAGKDYVASLLGGLTLDLSQLQDGKTPERRRSQELLAFNRLQDMQTYLEEYTAAMIAKLQEIRDHKDDYLVDKAVRMIEVRYGTNEISLTRLAEDLFVSPNHLGFLFKRKTGKTVLQFLTEYRLGKAEELLRTTKIKVSEVAGRIGLTNISYFCTLFKQEYGMTPGEYQEFMQRR